MSVAALRTCLRVLRSGRMPVTRSSSRLSGVASTPAASASSSQSKRKTPTTSPAVTPKRTKFNDASEQAEAETSASLNTAPASDLSVAPPKLVPAVLTFSFDEAKKHLIGVDHRFEDIFAKMQCKPFEILAQVHPFRNLTTSILGQQISWKAARSITHKFIRLYDASLPEKVSDYMDTEAAKSPVSFFPTPEQVLNTDTATLRSAGLSQRKVEYVQDLAARFVDGRLSTEKLVEATDEELAEMLIQVKGIGRWTVDMFAIFSLRRPDILPVGDLGVQRGMLRWFLALHSPADRFSISPSKVGSEESIEKAKSSNTMPPPPPPPPDKETLPSFAPSAPDQSATTITGDFPAELSVPLTDSELLHDQGSLPFLPPLFTPSVNKILQQNTSTPAPLPDKLTPGMLKTRLVSKTKIKGAFLSPKEMADLTEPWRPYRSIGVYYMWSLADADGKE